VSKNCIAEERGESGNNGDNPQTPKM
jgi:hypothetical protein